MNQSIERIILEPIFDTIKYMDTKNIISIIEKYIYEIKETKNIIQIGLTNSGEKCLCKSKYTTRFDVRHGKFEEYIKNIITKEGTYYLGHYEGKIIIYSYNHKENKSFKQYEYNYKNGKKEGEYIEYNQKGEIVSLTNYKNDLIDGEYIRFYNNTHIVKQYTKYKDGKREEQHKEWWDSGILRFECSYINDKLNGDYIEYYSNGNIMNKLYYSNDIKMSENKLSKDGKELTLYDGVMWME